ncbi:winged helix DNA-binding protein [Treponema sp.]
MHEQLCALKGLLRAVSRLEESIRDAYGISLTEALVLCAVDGGCTAAGNLTDDVGISASRLSRILAQLEKKALIHRTRRSDDKRNWDNEVTLKGRALLKKMKNEGIDMPSELESLGKTIVEGA